MYGIAYGIGYGAGGTHSLRARHLCLVFYPGPSDSHYLEQGSALMMTIMRAHSWDASIYLDDTAYWAPFG